MIQIKLPREIQSIFAISIVFSKYGFIPKSINILRIRSTFRFDLVFNFTHDRFVPI